MERNGIRVDFVERFMIFTDAYDRARNDKEKSFLTENFLKDCTEEEVTLVRNVIGDVLQKNGFNLPYKLFH